MATQKDIRALEQLIRETREERGLSIRKLAELAGLHHSFVSKLEAGHYDNVSPETLMALAKAMDVSPADYFTLAGFQIPDSLPSFGPYLRSRYGEQLTPADREALTHMFDVFRRNHHGPDQVDDEDDRQVPHGARP